MKNAEIDGIRWRTAKQLYAAYLKGCELEDGLAGMPKTTCCFETP